MRSTLLLPAALPLLVTGCGADDAESDPGTPPSTASTGTPAGSADCTTDAVATFPGAGEVALQDGKAVPLGGPSYTIFAGDFEVPGEGLAFSGYEAGPGEHLAFVATIVYNASDTSDLEVGTVIEWTDAFEVLTFAVVLDEEGEQHGTNIGASGTLTVIGLDDASICVDVDYRDEEKSVVGTIAATIV